MIRPDTPPGTEVVCIDASPGRWPGDFLVLGALYTVDRIGQGVSGGHVVLLKETKPFRVWDIRHGALLVGWRLDRFRYLDLPGSLTELLEKKLVDCWEDA